MSKPLHLPDLTIKGFRGIDHLTIPRLGRVTLLAGKNGVGKTTVLEAVRVFAARGHSSTLCDLLTDRDEVELVADENANLWMGEVDPALLFYGRKTTKKAEISIGSDSEPIRIDMVSLDDEFPELSNLVDSLEGVSVRFGNKRRIQWNYSSKNIRSFPHHQPLPKNDDPDPGIRCECLGPGTPSDNLIAGFWDSVALTDDEDRVLGALKLVLDNDIRGAAVIDDDDSASSYRRTVVRLGEQDRPVPLKSLGDGAVRLFAVALALANSRRGILLIDEAENGIHHTLQYDLWKMILRTAQANDVQVLATTHSWDCVRGFAYAAAEIGEAEGVLVRLDRDDRGLRAIEYSEEDLKIAADQGIEVR